MSLLHINLQILMLLVYQQFRRNSWLKETSALSDSFQDGLLSPPVYTRPADYKGWKVPEVLLSGNPKLIREWQDEQALERTKLLRPELLGDSGGKRG